MTAVDPLAAAVAELGALPMPVGVKPFQTAPPRPEHADVPLEVLERQLAELRAHADAHLAERGETATGQLIDQWHEFLDIDPDLRGRDYTPQPRKAS